MRNAIGGNGHTPVDSPLNLEVEFEKSPRSATNLLQQFRYRLQNNRTVRRATGGVTRAAHYVHDTSAKDVAVDIDRLVRQRPVTALLVAAVAGFLIGRSMRRR